MAAARPREEDPIEQGYIRTPALRALVRQHVGARTCPASVGRATLEAAALRLRLATPDAFEQESVQLDDPSGGLTIAEPGRKRTRVDRSEVNKRRKVLKLITVKCALLGRLRNGPDPGPTLRVVAQIRSRVEAYSRRVVNASLALATIVKGVFRRDTDSAAPMNADLSWIADVPVPPEIFTQTFFRQLLLGTSGAQQPSQAVAQCHLAHPQLLLPGNRHLGDRNIYSAGAIQYLTNLKNALRTELDDRIKVACHRLGLDKDAANVVRYRINGWTLPQRFGCCLPQTRAAEDAVFVHRRMLGLSGRTQIDETWLKNDANLPSLLRYSVYLNKVYQASENRLFNLVPICNVRAHFIRIDTSVLYGVLREAGVVDRMLSFQLFEGLRDVFWFDTFDFRKIKPGGVRLRMVRDHRRSQSVHDVRERGGGIGEQLRWNVGGVCTLI